ncbi:TPA: motility genes transcriptional repressor MogR, partial [Listeria monocytogenes]|nr:motility genes transcriptional repressor MogR [Listeria monocytogenes]
LLTEFYQAVEEHGGIEKYMHSNISWLKIELELLSACYQIAILEDMKVLDISEMLSLNDLRIFPKTPSQLQNTYYKLKKELIQVEDIPKNKPGRKRKTQKNTKKEKTNIFGKVVPAEFKAPTSIKEQISYDKSREKNLVDLLSGVKSNVQLLSENQGEENNVYDLLKSIYSLSSLAVQKEELDKKYQDLQTKCQELEQENSYLKQQNETMTDSFHTLVLQVADFAYASDLDQIQALPLFSQQLVVTLNQLGVFKENYKQM